GFCAHFRHRVATGAGLWQNGHSGDPVGPGGPDGGGVGVQVGDVAGSLTPGLTIPAARPRGPYHLSQEMPVTSMLRISSRLLVAALVVGAACAGGCQILGFGGAMVDNYKRNSTHNVEPEYRG